MNPTTFKARVAAWADQYGMAAVLVLLCGYYSWATYEEQQPRGSAAAERVARQLGRASLDQRRVVLVAQTTESDVAFMASVQEELVRRGYEVIDRVQGDPRSARQALQKLAADQQRIDWIVTTADAGSWTLWEHLEESFPALGQPRLVYPTSYRWPTFLRRENLLNIANQIAVVAILAAGMTVVIITGGIDLSVGSLIALSAVVTTLLIRDVGGGTAASAFSLVNCSVGGIAAGALFGLFSGLMITGFKIPPFIATLAVMQVANGTAYILARGNSIYEVADSFTWLGRGVGPFSLPNAVVLMALIYLAMHGLMSRTILGRHIYAVGSNTETARLCGVRVSLVLLFAYTISGLLAGVGGVVLASQLKSGSPTYGLTYELYVIAAVVVGGTSLSGGEGRIFGTLIGAFIIAVIQNGMNLTGVESYSQKVVLGVVILGAVLLDRLKKQGWQGLRRRLTRAG